MRPSLRKLGLGASQFPTGAPLRGRPPEAEVRDMLIASARADLGFIDAGGASPLCETMLGEHLPRPVPMGVLIRSVRGDRGPDGVEAEVRATLTRLRLPKARAVVVQSASDLFAPSGQSLWDRLKKLRDEGLFDQVGVCAYASDDPVGLSRRFKPDLLQAPASLLDQRLLLDGLLFLPPDRVPAQLKGAAGRLSRARRMIAEGRSDPLQAALGFALSRPEADAVIVGASSAAELAAVIAAASSPPPDLDWDEMAIDDPIALDPDRWVAA